MGASEENSVFWVFEEESDSWEGETLWEVGLREQPREPKLRQNKARIFFFIA